MKKMSGDLQKYCTIPAGIYKTPVPFIEIFTDLNLLISNNVILLKISKCTVDFYLSLSLRKMC
jgi:hypothetical protein